MVEKFDQLRKFLLVIGNARSGTTLLGAALDSHPSVVLANETLASANLWRDMDRNTILSQTFQKAIFDHQNSRSSEGYTFSVGNSPESKTEITVMGDKIHNPSMLYLHGDYQLIPSLTERLELPLYFIHAIRNPFDVIATMHHWSGAPLSNRIRWYFMHCEAAAAISERIPEEQFLHTYHEDFVHSPETELERLCHFVDVAYIPDHGSEIRNLVFIQPRLSRNTIQWQQKDIDAIFEGMQRFSFLTRYVSTQISPID